MLIKNRIDTQSLQPQQTPLTHLLNHNIIRLKLKFRNVKGQCIFTIFNEFKREVSVTRWHCYSFVQVYFAMSQSFKGMLLVFYFLSFDFYFFWIRFLVLRFAFSVFDYVCLLYSVWCFYVCFSLVILLLFCFD